MQKPVFKIAWFGSSLVSSYWNGAATYYRGIIRQLAAQGHEVHFYEPDAFDRQKHRDIPDPSWARVHVYESNVQAVDQALEDAADADVIIKASGVGVFDSYLERRVLELRRIDKMIVFWDVDAPVTLASVQSNPDDPFRECIPQYDMILTYGGGEPVRQAYLALGARECVPIYNAFDSTTHYPALPEKRYQATLAFMGNRLPDREQRVKEFFLKPARLMSNRRFILGGSGWGDKRLPDNVDYVGHVYTRDHNAFNCSPLAVLNINRQRMSEYGFSPATRVFEAAGAGACLITDAWEGVEQFLEPGYEILVAEDGNAVAQILAKLTPARANQIGAAARARVLRDHTYEQRVLELEAILNRQLLKDIT